MAPGELINPVDEADRVSMNDANSHSLKSRNKLIQPPFANPSLQVTADHNLKRADAPVFAPQEGEVLLQIKATGICGYVTEARRFI